MIFCVASIFLIHFVLLTKISNRHRKRDRRRSATDPISMLQSFFPNQPAFTLDNSVGTFQGLPVTYHKVKENDAMAMYSSVHCVGENFRPDNTSWMVRSCEFRNLCFDMSANEFVLFQSPHEQRLQQRLDVYRRRRKQDPNLVAISTLAE